MMNPENLNVERVLTMFGALSLTIFAVIQAIRSYQAGDRVDQGQKLTPKPISIPRTIKKDMEDILVRGKEV